MLGFLSKTQSVSVAELIAKRKFAKAISLIKGQLTHRRSDPRLRLQLSEVLVLSGKTNDAVALLSELSDDYALSGAAAKAIALLKKIQTLDPGRPDVEERLAYLISQQERPSPDPWARPRSTAGVIHPEPASPSAASQAAAFPGDMEEIPEAEGPEIGISAQPAEELNPETTAPFREVTETPPLLETIPAAQPTPDESFDLDVDQGQPATTEPSAAPSGVVEEEMPTQEALRDELMALIEDVFTGQVPLEAAPLASLPVVETPLFRDFSCEELLEVIRGLKLRAFEPGEIVVTEDEPGASLFVLTSGSVRAYVRDRNGRYTLVRRLLEGDFFGEISLLKGGRRTATITASSRCELLEIDQETFGSIAQKHPHVWEVLKQFYDQRAGSSLEEAARSGRGAEGSAKR